jgi:hypothetical protein
MSLSPQQIDRALVVAEAVVSLAADVWQHRKQRGGRLAGRVASGRAAPRKVGASRRAKTRNAAKRAVPAEVQ